MKQYVKCNFEIKYSICFKSEINKLNEYIYSQQKNKK